MSGIPALEPEDLERAAVHGLPAEEIRRQLQLLVSPPPAIVLDRPCTIGDGIECIGQAATPSLLAAHHVAVATGRATYFVPASGAATRMFKSLLALRSRGQADRSSLEADDDPDAQAVVRFFDGLPRFAFASLLDGELRRRGDSLDGCLRHGAVAPVLAALLDADGLAYAETPKGLLPFHTYSEGSRTAFDEHLSEAFAVAASADGTTRLHFTVSPNHRDAFVRRAATSRGAFETALGARLEIGFSTQASATDTVAIDLEGRPFREEDGALLFRPGGHGSLLTNLADLTAAGADLIFVKNIDNVVHEDWRAPVVHWRRLLAGRLVVAQNRIFEALSALENGADRQAVALAARVAREELGFVWDDDDLADSSRAAAALRLRLDRPLRVCAMLRATGHTGGGPFWVRSSDGTVSPQIVESAQIDSNSAEQREIEARATHFSPADMVLGVRSFRGEAFDLRQYVDPNAVFIAEKSSGGRSLRALEHPGLWNGAMAHWNTIFVEVPPSVFQPVKTVLDLLHPAHQPAEPPA